MNTLLSIRDLTRSFPYAADKSLTVLKAVNLDVANGEAVGIIGPSGSGKSTLLHLAGTLDRPTAGRIVFDGKDVAALGEEDTARFRNRSIGFVFQQHGLLPQCTLLENVLVPTLAVGDADEKAAEARARMLLERAGLGERLDHFPAQLSGGECQRTAVARALINKPRLLIADEPTGSLDHATAEAVTNLLFDLRAAEGIALLVATHSAGLALRMDRVLRLEDGVAREEILG